MSLAAVVLQVMAEFGTTLWHERGTFKKIFSNQLEWAVTINGQRYYYIATPLGRSGQRWELAFLDEKGRSDLTGVGHKTAVGVLSAAQHFLDRIAMTQGAQLLQFTAIGRSRQRLYDRMVRQFVAQYPGARWAFRDTDPDPDDPEGERVERLYVIRMPDWGTQESRSPVCRVQQLIQEIATMSAGY
jgi:hypothetical protein